MKLKTELDIQQYLDDELAWRLKEIDYTKGAIDRVRGGAQITMVRAGVALLYAHWEGFVKNSTEAFLNYVLNRNLKYRQLRACFIAHGMAGHLQSLTESQKHHRRSESVQFILDHLDQQARFPWKDLVRTQGNLNFAVFKSVAASIAIDSTVYETRSKWIDIELLARRNKIAHGERLELAASEFPGLANETLHLLRMFKTDIENAVVTKSYMSLGPPSKYSKVPGKLPPIN